MDISELEKILAILRQNDVSEFELEDQDTRIRLSRAVCQHAQPAAQPLAVAVEPAIATPSAVQATEKVKPDQSTDGLVRIESPLVGTFYRRPSPDAEPFVNEGQVVKKGDVLCIVEAMKLMNEIEASCDGRIEKIMISDGEVVEYGELLFLINPMV